MNLKNQNPKADYKRSSANGNGTMLLDTINHHKSPQLLIMSSGASSYSQFHMAKSSMDFKFNKGKKTAISGSSSSNPWSFGEPEFKRKKRVANYTR
ncbi:hypothetical protein F3Y22_tig00111013pilonHSYRG00241 [Hibiscus syriacus]|uniref:Uncharacterized protein n=1 Tax=Hibiscus syriacus TaxID=106335 RepID=A0A6A2Z827_HIBSY|nr:hypothetical protein F3Y22_tig00111013pilonHSYRG00241 [Hibiscus syriacus]